MEYKDYYAVLGVDRNASKEEISKAYKRLAREYHPDLNKGSGSEDKFKELNEAYEVLKDPETRKRYDTLGANWKHGAPFEPPPGWAGGPGQHVHFDFGGGGGGGSGFSDFFETIFGGFGRGRRGGGPSAGGPGMGGGGINIEDLFGAGGPGGGFGQPAPQRGQDVESTLTIQLEDSFRGAKKAVEFSGPSGKRRYDVTIPRGIRDGERIRLAGQGRAGPGGTAGDLYVTLQIAPHPQFEVQGDDLVTRVEVPAWDAALGCKVQVPTPEGEVTMTLPRGCSSGQRLRLKGRGMPRRNGSAGDLYAELKITVPKQLNDEQERLFRSLRRAADDASPS